MGGESNPLQVIFSIPKSFVDYLPPLPIYKFHPKDPLEVDAIPLGCLIAEFARIMSALLRNKKRKIMVGVEFVLFFFTEIAHGGESWTIAVLG